MRLIFLGITFAVGIATAQNNSISLEGVELHLGMSKSDALALLTGFEIQRQEDFDGHPIDLITVRKKDSTGGIGERHTLQFEKGNLIWVNKDLGSTESKESMRMLSQLFYAISRSAVTVPDPPPGQTAKRVFVEILTDEFTLTSPAGETRSRSVTIELPAGTGVTRELTIYLGEPIGRSGSSVGITESLHRPFETTATKNADKH